MGARPGFRTDKLEQLRIPPHSVDAEQAVLGAIMMAPEAFWPVRALLKPDDFYRRDHQLIFEAIGDLDSKGKPYDCIHLGEWFEAKEQSEQVAGGAYLIELQTGIASAVNVEGYAKIVAQHAMSRRLIDAGMQLVNMGFRPEGREPDEVAALAVATIEKCDRTADVAGKPIRQVMKTVFDRLQKTMDWQDGQLTGMRYGYPELEELHDGLCDGCSYGVGARTKMGKTILLENIATNVARQGKAVGFWSIEMGELELGRRQLAHVSGVDEKKLKRGKLMDDSDWSSMTAAIQEIKDLRYRIFDDPVVTVEKIMAQAMMLKARGDLDLAVIDYLQIVQSSGLERRDLDVGHVSWGFKQIAKRLGIPVLWAFAIGRGNEKGSSVRPPKPSDARESGNIEQDLDAMILIHRPGYYDKKTRGARVELALNRSGETGIVRLEDDLARCRFLPSNRQWADDDAGNYDATGF